MTIIEFLEARVSEDEFDASRELLWGTTPTLTKMNARALAECAAKRAIIRDYLATSNAEAWWSQDAHKTNAARAGAWTFTLRHLAAVYDYHPDYQKEWTP